MFKHVNWFWLVFWSIVTVIGGAISLGGRSMLLNEQIQFSTTTLRNFACYTVVFGTGLLGLFIELSSAFKLNKMQESIASLNAEVSNLKTDSEIRN